MDYRFELIKKWKQEQIKNDMRGGFLEEEIGVVKETEKAVLLKLEWGYTSNLTRTVTVWIPKSVFMTEEELAQEIQETADRFKRGCERYEAVLNHAKEIGVKGARKGMKLDTLLKKIAEIEGNVSMQWHI